MNSCKIIFSNGESLVVQDGSKLIGIHSRDNRAVNISDKEKFYYPRTTSTSEPLELWLHASAGMIPSLTEFLCNFEYFYLLDKENEVFSSNAIVKLVSI